MDCMRKIGYSTAKFFDGTCFKNFYYNNTKNSRESIIAKVMAAAVLAGLVTLFISFALVPVVIVIVGLSAFAYETAEGKNTTFHDFKLNVLQRLRK